MLCLDFESLDPVGLRLGVCYAIWMLSGTVFRLFLGWTCPRQMGWRVIPAIAPTVGYVQQLELLPRFRADVYSSN